MAGSIFMLVISLGMIVAGWGYVRMSRRMRTFQTTRGRVVGRELATVGADTREARWGSGGGYRPKVTYTYTVAGVEYTSDKSTYAHRGLKKRLAEQQLAAIPDEVDVHYDPASPATAFLEKHNPRLGYWLVGFGILFALIALISMIPV
jgi:Protein of unknown function (DUF3592)